jgi:hypothetical protein
MKQLRNTRTGKLVVYDKKILELGYYEVVDDQPEEVSAPEVMQETVVATPQSPEEVIKAAAQKLLKRKKSGGGIQEEVSASEKISIQLTRG